MRNNLLLIVTLLASVLLAACPAYRADAASNSWCEQVKLSGEPGERFGCDVAISRDYAVVGSRDDDGGAGSVFVYQRFGNNWRQMGDKVTVPDGGQFGSAVALDQDRFIAGACDDDDNGFISGAAYVFQRVAGQPNWVQMGGKLVASDAGAGHQFGANVSISGDWAIVGAESNQSAYLFHYDGNAWTELQKLSGVLGGYFGNSVSISGDVAVVGAYWEGGAGAAYVFRRAQSDHWQQEQKLTGGPGHFGSTVWIDGNRILVGEYLSDTAYLFEWDGSVPQPAIPPPGWSVWPGGETCNWINPNADSAWVTLGPYPTFLATRTWDAAGGHWDDPVRPCGPLGSLSAIGYASLAPDGTWMIYAAPDGLWWARKDGDCWTPVGPIGEVPRGTHPSFNGKQLYYQAGYGHVYVLDYTGVPGQFVDPSHARQVTSIAGDGTREGGPWISTDGKLLLFSSDRSGGYGRLDIWAAERQEADGEWTSVRNLGPNVNTAWHEDLPRLAENASSLFFSSNEQLRQAKMGSWVLLGAPLKGAPGSWFSNGAIKGDYVIVGAKYDREYGTYAGAAYTFHWDGMNWALMNKLFASDAGSGQEFGQQVAITDGYAIVGAEPGGSAAYIFHDKHLPPKKLGMALTYLAVDLNPSGIDYSQARAVGGGQQVGFGFGPATGGVEHALLWAGTAASVVDLNPAGFRSSRAWGVRGGYQGGYGVAADGHHHALLWAGTASSVVNLHPEGFSESELGAGGMSDGKQAGRGSGPQTGGQYHALLWFGTPESVVDLHPSGFDWSVAEGVSGNQQVGWGSGPGGWHALLWSGRADTVVDLNPAGFTESEARAVSQRRQVGYGKAPSTGGQPHALLWSGTADSVIDLHPSGFTLSVADGIWGNDQVGMGWGPGTGGKEHALLWSGAAETVVDLHAFLPSEYVSSYAKGIDANGNIVGFARTTSGQHRAVAWLRHVAGDVEGNGYVDVSDLLILARNWGKSKDEPGYDPRCEFNGDGRVDVSDLLMLAGNWGT